MNYLRKSIKPFVLAFRILYWEYIIKRFFKTKELNIMRNISLEFSTNNDIPKLLYANNSKLTLKSQRFEFLTIELIIKLIKDSSVFFDVGANVGLFTLIAHKVNSDCIIHAFEPSKSTYDALVENVRLNFGKQIEHRIFLHNIGFSNIEGVAKIATPSSTSNVFNDSFRSLVINDQSKGFDVEDISLTTLNNFIEYNKIANIDLIKVDIEGAEFLLVQGGLQFLKRQRPTIVFENTDLHNYRFGHTVADILYELKQIGYTIFSYEESQWVAFANDNQKHKEIINEFMISVSDK